jgi:RNA polymerase sigma factor (sigma-70 family)
MEQCTKRTPNVHDMLACLAAAGDPWSREEIIRQYDSLLSKVARNLLPGTESATFDDLKQVATLAMLELLPKYDMKRASLMTFAFRWLPLRTRRLLDGEFQDRIVSPPINVLQGDRSRLKNTGVAEHLLNASVNIFDRTIGDGEMIDAAEFLSRIAPDTVQPDYNEANVLTKQVLAAVDSLSDSDRALIRLYYLQGATLQNIASQLGRTRQAVNVALSKALHRLQFKLGLHNDYTHSNIRIKNVRSIRAATRH